MEDTIGTPVNWDERLDRYSMRNGLGFTQFTHRLFSFENGLQDQHFDRNMDDLLNNVSGQADNPQLRKTYKENSIPYIEHDGKLISSGAVIELCGLICDERIVLDNQKLNDLVLNKLKEKEVPLTDILTLLKKCVQSGEKVGVTVSQK